MKRWWRHIAVLMSVLALMGVQSHAYWHRHDCAHAGHFELGDDHQCQVCAVSAQATGDGIDTTPTVAVADAPSAVVRTFAPQIHGVRAIDVVRSRGPPARIA